MHSEKSDIIQVNSSNSYIYENIPICTNETKENPPFGLVIYKVIIVLLICNWGNKSKKHLSLLGLQRSDINPKNSSIHFTKSVKPRSNFMEQKCVFSWRNNFCHYCQNKQTAIFGNWHGCTKSWKKKSNVSFMSKVYMKII